jgi:hypothetical protein
MTIRCPECRRRFAPPRRDAVYCSAKCRVKAWRHRGATTEAIRDAVAPAAPTDPSAEPTPLVGTAPDDELNGWRRVGPYLLPPLDPRNVIHIG